jgi:hypothetical protein
LIEDSDGEEEYILPPPAPTPVVEPTPVPTHAPVVEEPVVAVEATSEPKKKAVARKVKAKE